MEKTNFTDTTFRQYQNSKYEKTDKGWVKQVEEKKEAQVQGKKEYSDEELAGFARNASDEGLKKAGAGANERMRIAAKKELLRRQTEGAEQPQATGNPFDDAMQKGCTDEFPIRTFGSTDYINKGQGWEILEKGKKADIGEIRDWGGHKYQKTANGWVPVKGQNSHSPKGDSDQEEDISGLSEEERRKRYEEDVLSKEKEYAEKKYSEVSLNSLLFQERALRNNIEISKKVGDDFHAKLESITLKVVQAEIAKRNASKSSEKSEEPSAQKENKNKNTDKKDSILGLHTTKSGIEYEVESKDALSRFSGYDKVVAQTQIANVGYIILSLMGDVLDNEDDLNEIYSDIESKSK